MRSKTVLLAGFVLLAFAVSLALPQSVDAQMKGVWRGRLWGVPVILYYPAGYAGDPFTIQVGGVTKWKIDKDGDLAVVRDINATRDIWAGQRGIFGDVVTAGGGLDVTGNAIISGTTDGVDVSTHNHATAVAQTRLAAKDRTEFFTFALPFNLAAATTFHLWGKADSVAGPGWVPPYDMHMTRLTLTACSNGVGGQGIEALFQLNGVTTDLSVALSEAGGGDWHTGTDTESVAVTTSDEVVIKLATNATANWSYATATLEGTID